MRLGGALEAFPDNAVPSFALEGKWWFSRTLGLTAELEGGSVVAKDSVGNLLLADFILGVGAQLRGRSGLLTFFGGPRLRSHELMAFGDADDGRSGLAIRTALGLGVDGGIGLDVWRITFLAGAGLEAVIPRYDFTLDGAPAPGLGVMNLSLSLGAGWRF